MSTARGARTLTTTPPHPASAAGRASASKATAGASRPGTGGPAGSPAQSPRGRGAHTTPRRPAHRACRPCAGDSAHGRSIRTTRTAPASETQPASRSPMRPDAVPLLRHLHDARPLLRDRARIVTNALREARITKLLLRQPRQPTEVAVRVATVAEGARRHATTPPPRTAGRRCARGRSPGIPLPARCR